MLPGSSLLPISASSSFGRNLLLRHRSRRRRRRTRCSYCEIECYLMDEIDRQAKVFLVLFYLASVSSDFELDFQVESSACVDVP